MKKIVFNASILDDKLTGLGVYCKNILSRLNEDKIDNVIYTDKYKKNSDKLTDVIINVKNKNKFLGIFLRNYYLYKFFKKNKKILYSPTQHGVNIKGAQQIITIHDLTPLYYPEGRVHQYIYYKYILKYIIKNSKYIITVSNNTKKDIIKEYKVKADKVKVIYNGFDNFSEEINKEQSVAYIKNKYNIEKFILMVGIHYSYKNLHSVIEAYSNLKDLHDTKIVIVGDDTGKYAKQLKRMVKEKNLMEKILFLGFIDNKDKNEFYRAAKAFVYPSKYEGFGFPVLEAMANETLVVCSEKSSLKEVVGDAAYTFNPNSLIDIEKALITIMNISSVEYKAYIKKGQKRIKYFSWDKCVQEVEKVINLMSNEEKEFE